MPERYRERIRELSSRLVEAQRPIRILDAIKWDESISSFFLRTGFKQIPPCGPEYYARVPLRFDPVDKLRQLEDLRRAIPARLGRRDPVGRILSRNCRQFEDVVHMLTARGKPQFYHYSRRLYGSTKDNLGDSRTTLRDLSFVLEEILGSIDKTCLGTDYPKLVPAEDVVDELNRRLSGYFRRPTVRAKLDDGIVSDAAAGGEYIKIKRGALFSTRDIDILEVHEGWVHVGTTLNGRSQPWARWLAKGPPCVAAVQEGLATLLEVFAFVSHPARVRRLNNRLRACDMAEDGANILEVLDFYRQQGCAPQEALSQAQRIFRGGLLEGGAPFTKDISYCKGFVTIYNFLRSAIRFGRPELIPFLFAGKIALEDIPVLYALHEDGIVTGPKYLPRQFSSLDGLAAWMAFSNFLNRMDLARIQDTYRRTLLAKPS
ncbi:MAG: flavohemoglobin expression-modulating QEGLA motif protein [Thermoguttaceae bacterium]|jgi:uncharacterized protein (TIGR02421 family)